jgi:hypothetical protein
MPLVGCRNLFQACGPTLVITPNFDSTSVGGTGTFQALREGGGCGLTKTEAAPVNAVVWRVHLLNLPALLSAQQLEGLSRRDGCDGATT